MRTRVDGPRIGAAVPKSVAVANHSEKPDGFGGWESFGETSTTQSSIENGAYEYRITHDVVTPGFHARRGRGEIINSPYDSRYEERYSSALKIALDLRYENYPPPNTTRKFFKSVQGEISTTALGMTDDEGVIPHSLSPLSDGDLLALQAETLTEAWAKLSSAPMQIWATLGELNETVETVRTIVQSIAELFVSGKKQIPKHILARFRREADLGNPVTWSQLKREAQSFWLLLRYGIRPLCYDLVNALKALDKIGMKTRTRFAYQRTLSGTTEERFRYDLGHGTSIGYRVKVTRNVSSSSGILVQPLFLTENLVTVIGTGSFVTAAWELVPFSFVVDWFTNIGKVLSSWAPSVTVVPLTSWTVLRSATTIEGWIPPEDSIIAANYNGWPLVQGSLLMEDGKAFQYIKTTERIPRPSRSVVPNLYIKLGAMKGIDLFALFSDVRFP